MTELSARTLSHVKALFEATDVAAAEAILVVRCGAQLPGMSLATPVELERIRFAALRLSRGRLAELEAAAALAEADWRDLLVAAGFADDPAAHLDWRPTELG